MVTPLYSSTQRALSCVSLFIRIVLSTEYVIYML